MSESSKDRLIAEQQLEIRKLRKEYGEAKTLCETALSRLYIPEQWSVKCEEFPRIAQKAIVEVRGVLEELTND